MIFLTSDWEGFYVLSLSRHKYTFIHEKLEQIFLKMLEGTAKKR
jgi:hypothetical protein